MSGIVELLPGLRLSPLPQDADPAPLPADPAEEITARFASVAATAVHPFEVAAAIEAEGLTDRQIRREYGRQDVFELAEELFDGVDRHYGEPAPLPSPWRRSPARCLLRGGLYTLPVLGYVLGSHLLAGPPDRWGLPHGTLGLACSVLVSWGWNQAVSHRVHTWLGIGDRRGAALALLRGAPLGVLLAFVVTLVATLAAPPTGGPAVGLAARYAPLWFGLGQSLYFAASTALLLLGLDTLLLLCLLPTVIGAGWVLAPGPGPDGSLRVLLLMGSLVPSVLLAAAAVGRILVRERGRATGDPGRLRAVLPSGVFGLAVGTLTLAAGLGDFVGGVPGRTGAAAPHTVALTLSMGIAEWLLYVYRRRIDSVLATARSARDFGRRSAYALLDCLGRYLALLAALAVAVTALWTGTGRPTPLALLGLLALGAVIWLALVLQATGSAWTAAVVCTGTALAMLAVLLVRHGGHGPAGGPLQAGSADEALVCGLAAAVLVALSGRLLGRVTRHR